MSHIAFIVSSPLPYTFLPRAAFRTFLRTPTTIPTSYRPTKPPLSATARLPPPTKTIPAVAYVAYMTHLFLLPPTGPLTPLITLKEAANLSLNFAYITPLIFPSLAPSLHPLLESTFHFVVAWALLLLSFISEDLSTIPRKAPPATPFLLATPFLTNIFYLLYLVLRVRPQQDLRAIPLSRRTTLQKLADGPFLSLTALVLVAASIPWALFARPEFGSWAQRYESFLHLLGSDILAHSFAVDLLVFSIFQAWLVRDDAARREWQGEYRGVVRLATFLPFFGLVAYLFARAQRGRVQWQEDKNGPQ